MIRWNRFTCDQIRNKWRIFKQMRIKKHDTLKSTDKAQITCLERETLIDNLLTRLRHADRVIDSYTKFKESIED